MKVNIKITTTQPRRRKITRDGSYQVIDIFERVAKYSPHYKLVLLTANLVGSRPYNFDGRIGADILQPGVLDGGTRKTTWLSCRDFLVGRTSGAVKGRVTSINADIKMTGSRGGEMWLKDVVITGRISNGGDGGGAILDAQGRLVGIHWGGSSTSSIFIPIQRILQELNVTLAP